MARKEKVVRWQDLTDTSVAPVHGSFKVRCPDGRVRWMMDRNRCGFSTSAQRSVRKLWWHDLVHWPAVGIGPATWNWTWRRQCRFVGPNGQQCALPDGHVFYLHLPGHRLANGRRFVARITPYWPMKDPKRVAA